VFQVLFERLPESGGYAGGVEAEGIAGDSGLFADKLDVDYPELDSNAGLFVKVLTPAAGDGEASGFGPNGRGSKHGRVWGVKFLKQIRRLGMEYVPETGDFGADFFGAESCHS
jgi:hypothetical protein